MKKLNILIFYAVMINYPTIRHMRAFVSVARLSSFGRAADELCISQSALSQNISQLEEILRVKLIDRTTRSVQLTPIGEQVYPRMRRWLEEMEETIADVQNLGRLSKGHVKVACLASVAIRYLPSVIDEFETEHPAVRVSIRDDTGFGVEQRVLERAADFGVAGGPVRSPNIEFTPLFEEPFCLVCPEDHSLAKKDSVTWAEIADYHYIALGEETNIGRQLISALKATQVSLNIVHEFSQLGSVWGLIDKGQGVSALPVSACPEHGNIKVLELTGPKVTRQVGTLTVRDRSLTPAARAFRSTLERFIKSSTSSVNSAH